MTSDPSQDPTHPPAAGDGGHAEVGAARGGAGYGGAGRAGRWFVAVGAAAILLIAGACWWTVDRAREAAVADAENRLNLIAEGRADLVRACGATACCATPDGSPTASSCAPSPPGGQVSSRALAAVSAHAP
jgi:hypothetical protein